MNECCIANFMETVIVKTNLEIVFSRASASNIGQYLLKLCQEYCGLFFPDTVYVQSCGRERVYRARGHAASSA